MEGDCKVSKQTELEKLQRKINAFLKLNNELIKVGMYNITLDNDRRYLLADLEKLVDLSEKYGLELDVTQRNVDKYPWKVTLHELKMYAIASNEEMELMGLLPESV